MSDSDYDFQYSDDDQSLCSDEEDEVHTENQYYSSKALIEAERYDDALKGFREVVDASGGNCSEWGFKALKQVVKVKLLSRSADSESMIESYKQLLEHSSVVTRNAAEKKVNSLLEFVGAQKDGNYELLEQFYTSTLSARANTQNDRLYFRTSVKLATLYLATGQHGKAEEVVERLLEDAEEGGQLLEVYALRIQMLGSQADRSKHALLQATYRKALSITSAIPHPRVLGIIHQVGGKMHMMSSNWSDAATDFFKSFRAFDEAGMALERGVCLKYLVLANMMMESTVDPFDSQETRPYKTDPVVSAMTALVSAYQSSDIAAFERAMRHADIAGDSFIAPQLAELRKKMCSKVIVREVAPFSRVKLDTLCEFVGSSDIDVEELLLGLILDGRIGGHINQCDQVLEIDLRSRMDVANVSLREWASRIRQHG
jgi:COP9 signalosome complex subunit 2